MRNKVIKNKKEKCLHDFYCADKDVQISLFSTKSIMLCSKCGVFTLRDNKLKIIFQY